MKTIYTVFGNKNRGYRIAVPTKAKVADEYEFVDYNCDELGPVYFPKGTLFFVPKVKL